jgi:hypothetical protein
MTTVTEELKRVFREAVQSKLEEELLEYKHDLI